jgi:translocation protein SEC62
LQSDEYKKKSQKSGSILPRVDTREEAIAAFRLLQSSLLALRVEKVSAHHGHDHEHSDPPKPKKDKDGKKKKKKKASSDKPKPAQNLTIQRDQSIFSEDEYYAWFYETTQLQTILGGIGIVIVVFGAILFPLWPPILRTAVWYLSIALLGLIAGIIVIAIVRLILFVITMFAVPPGIWLFPNLFEDVGFFESFVPLWGWQKLPKSKRKKEGTREKGQQIPETSKTLSTGNQAQKTLHTTVEDASDEA